MVITSGCGSEYPGSIPGSRPKIMMRTRMCSKIIFLEWSSGIEPSPSDSLRLKREGGRVGVERMRFFMRNEIKNP